MCEHDRLVKLARRYALRECPVVISEIAGGREEPDVIGFRHGGESLLIECKASRSDYLAERNKPIRRGRPPIPGLPDGMGSRRYYLTPENLIRADELPQGWGLLECMKNKRTIGLRCGSTLFEKDAHAEINLLISALRRMHGYRMEGMSIRVYQWRTKNRAALIFKPIPCPDCNDTGYVDIDTGGGNSRKQFCTCPCGQELAEKDEKARAGEGD